MSDTTSMTPNTDSGAEEQRWSREVTVTADEEGLLRPTIRNMGQPLNTLNHRVVGRAATTSMTSSTAGTGLTYQTSLWSAVTGAPSANYSAVSYAFTMDWRAGIDLEGPMVETLGNACANKIDTIIAALFAGFSFATGSSGADLSEALILDADRILSTNARSAVRQGKTERYFCMHPVELDHFKSIPSMVRFDARGDGASPVVTGWTRTAHGLVYMESGCVQQSGGITSNGLYVRDALGYGFNTSPDVLVRREKVELATRLIAAFDMTAFEIVDAYGVEVRTTTTP